MGEPIGVSQGRERSATGVSTNNNVQASRRVAQVATNATPPSASGTRTTRAEPTGVAAFLREFPTIEAFGARYPDLAGLSLPDTIGAQDVASFESLLLTVLGPTLFSEFRQGHAPEVVLRGLCELAARQKKKAAEERPRKNGEQVTGNRSAGARLSSARPECPGLPDQSRARRPSPADRRRPSGPARGPRTERACAHGRHAQ